MSNCFLQTADCTVAKWATSVGRSCVLYCAMGWDHAAEELRPPTGPLSIPQKIHVWIWDSDKVILTEKDPFQWQCAHQKSHIDCAGQARTRASAGRSRQQHVLRRFWESYTFRNSRNETKQRITHTPVDKNNQKIAFCCNLALQRVVQTNQRFFFSLVSLDLYW
jgi:hypothetical protein